MQITVLREFWLDHDHGVISAGAVVDVEDIRARQLIQRGLATEGDAPTVKAKAPRANKARSGAPANKAPSPAPAPDPAPADAGAPAVNDPSADGSQPSPAPTPAAETDAAAPMAAAPWATDPAAA